MSSDAFVAKAQHALETLFTDAQRKNEFDFAISLNAEFRGPQAAGWSPAEEVLRAIRDFSEFLNDRRVSGRLRIRAALGFYCNMCEASGLYEVPKNMMRILSGERQVFWPFQDLVKEHQRTGELILPSGNRIMQDLIGHAKDLGRDDLAGVFADAFEPELRHAYAHADYVIWGDGIRICGKHLPSKKRIVPFDQFQSLVNRGAKFISILRSTTAKFVRSYSVPRVIDGSFTPLPGYKSLVSFCEATGTLTIKSHFSNEDDSR